MIGKYMAAKIVAQIWGRYVEKYCNLGMWSAQCDDINKFLFEIDLAKVIGVPSIAAELLELYTTFSKRIAILYHHDKNLMVSSYGNVFLAKSNYSLLIDGYEKIIANTLGYFREPLKFDLSLSSFANEYQITGTYDWSEERAVKFKLKVLESDENIRIVNGFDRIKK